MKKPLRSACVALFLGCLALPAQAATYYVDTNHPSANNNNPGTESLPWKTIGKANATLQPGDTVLIKAGTYFGHINGISPARSGEPGRPITYKNYGTDVVVFSEPEITDPNETDKFWMPGDPTTYYHMDRGITLENRSYIVVEGLNFSKLKRYLSIKNASHYNTIAYCNFDDALLKPPPQPNPSNYNYRPFDWAGSRIYYSSQHNWIHHCRFSKYGTADVDDNGVVLDVGLEQPSTASDKTYLPGDVDATRYNLIEDCLFYHGGHHVLGINTEFNVVRNCYFHNEPWMLGNSASDRGAVLYGNRNISFFGETQSAGRNLFERNRVGWCADSPDNWGASNVSVRTSNNILRFNDIFYGDIGGVAMSLSSGFPSSINNNKIYHNTIFRNTLSTTTNSPVGGITLALWNTTSLTVQNNVFKNNILYKHRNTTAYYHPQSVNMIAQQIWANNYDGDASGNPQFVNASETPTDPFDASQPDFTLQSTSPCKNYGTYLTTIVTAGGSGSSFQVADAGYFTDGWGIAGVEGDMIQLFGTTQKARITSVNYTTNWITLDRSVTWTTGQGISLPYNGAAPDAGAHEFEAVNNIVGFDVQKGSAGRGFVRYVDVTFQSAVGLDNLVAENRVKLTRYELNGSGGVSVSLAGVVSVSGNQVALNFGPNGIGGNPSSTTGDGYYVLRFDINGDGAFEIEQRFYRLFGDVDGDRKVTAVDAQLILAAYRQRGANLPTDVTGDGVVNALDRTLTIRSLNRKLADGLEVDD